MLVFAASLCFGYFCRINFTLQSLDVVSPAYDYFISRLDEMKKKDDRAIKVQKIPTDFPQYFKYDRVKELVRIKSVS